MADGYFLNEQDRTLFRQLRAQAARLGFFRARSPSVLPTVGRATADVAQFDTHNFQLQSGTPDNFANTGTTREAYALCDINDNAYVTLQWYTGNDSGGYWGATACDDGTTSELQTPCAAVTGGTLGNVDVTFTGATGNANVANVVAAINNTITFDQAGANDCQRTFTPVVVTATHPNSGGTVTHARLTGLVEALTLAGPNYQWRVALFVEYGTETSGGFTIGAGSGTQYGESGNAFTTSQAATLDLNVTYPAQQMIQLPSANPQINWNTLGFTATPWQ